MNIGFNANATNTFDPSSELAKMQVVKINILINLEKEVVINEELDNLMNKCFYSSPLIIDRIRNKIKRIVRWILKNE